ncbi:MAG: hypothetical protein JW987_09615 [Anaerolineaceae bacterium]|nr:hypothetical protein [Anaerolineaceae bacterium]
MSSIDFDTLKQSILTLLTEAYAGPPDPHETWFVDNAPDSGVFGAIRGLSAAQASRSVDGSGRSGTTVASNVEHLRWSMANANGAMRGRPYQQDWNESWKVIAVDEPTWEQLRRDLQSEFHNLCQAISTQSELPGPFLNGVLALAPHAAFHLGLIRQMVERVHEANNLYEGTHDQSI